MPKLCWRNRGLFYLADIPLAWYSPLPAQLAFANRKTLACQPKHHKNKTAFSSTGWLNEENIIPVYARNMAATCFENRPVIAQNACPVDPNRNAQPDRFGNTMSQTPGIACKDNTHPRLANRPTTGSALLILALVSGCARSPTLETLDGPGPAQAQTLALECERNFAFVARTEADAAWLFLPGRAVQLPRDKGGIGDNYSGAGIHFRYRHGRAQLELPDTRYLHCQNNPRRAAREHAKLNGIDFRATGAAPDWSFELTLDSDMELLTLPDRTRYRFTTPEPEVLEQARKTLYSAHNKSHQIVIELADTPCHNPGTKEALDVTVRIWLDDRVFRGCGGALH